MGRKWVCCISLSSFRCAEPGGACVGQDGGFSVTVSLGLRKNISAGAGLWQGQYMGATAMGMLNAPSQAWSKTGPGSAQGGMHLRVARGGEAGREG